MRAFLFVLLVTLSLAIGTAVAQVTPGSIGFDVVLENPSGPGSSAGNPLAVSEIVYINIIAYSGGPEYISINATGEIYLDISGGGELIYDDDRYGDTISDPTLPTLDSSGVTYFQGITSQGFQYIPLDPPPPPIVDLYLGYNVMDVPATGGSHDMMIAGGLPPVVFDLIIQNAADTEVMFDHIGIRCTGSEDIVINVMPAQEASPFGQPVIQIDAVSGTDTAGLGGQLTIYTATVEYTLTTQVIGGNGTLLPASGGTYPEGTQVNLTANPDPGYQVKAWTNTDNDGSTETTNTVTMNSDKTVSVEFEEIEQEPNEPVLSDLIINKATIKAGKQRDSQDKIIITGQLQDHPVNFNGIENVTMRIGSELEPDRIDFTINLNDEDVTLNPRNSDEKTKLTFKGSVASMVSLQIDLAKGKFSLSAVNTNLTGLTSPITAELSFGDYHGTATVDEDVINGANKTIPICLLSGHTDKVQIQQAKVGKNNDSLSVKGNIAAEDPVDLTQQQVTITWGDDDPFVIPTESFQQKNPDKQKYSTAKITLTGDAVFKATFDLDKCTFSIKVNNTQLQSTSGTVNMSIQWTGFYGEDDYSLD